MYNLKTTLDETLTIAQALEKNLDEIARKDWAESSEILSILDNYCYETRRMANELKDIREYITGGPDYYE